MSKRENYEIQEWQDLRLLACCGILSKLPAGQPDSRKINSISDAVIMIRELLALGTFLSQSLTKYGDYELMNDLILDLKENGKDVANEGSPIMIEDLDRLVSRANEILAERAEEGEAQAYRAFVYELAYEVANASGDGFLGLGSRINMNEAEFLHNLKTRLLGDE